MANIQTQNKTSKPLIIDKFFGLNIPKEGDTQLKIGESGDMTNCYITSSYDLSKIEGYLQLMSTGDKNIQGMWYGDIGGKKYFIYAYNGHIYKFTDNYWKDDTLWTNKTIATSSDDLGTLTDAPTSFFSFGGKLYIVNGSEYKYWTGTGVITDVAGYIPKVRISCVPATGAGTNYEDINLLTGKKRLTYNGDGTATYQLPETAVDSVDSVWVNGVQKTLTTHYTVVTATGVVTFTAGNFPATGLDNVEIYYTKGTGTRDIVLKNTKAFVYSQATDSRVFLFGHTVTYNQRIYSALADGVPSAEYFPATNIDLIGSPSYSITSMIQQQSVILTSTNQPATYSASYDSVDLNGVTTVTFPTPIINSDRGSLVQGQLINNDPFTIDTTLIKWVSTTIKDERNMQEIGSRIQKDFNDVDLALAKTIDFQSRFEMWIAIGKKVWIYNYLTDTFSRLELNDIATCFIVIDKELFFGTSTGQIMKFSEDYLTFNGTAINTYWEMNMYNFGADYLQKTLRNGTVTVAAQSDVELVMSYITDRDITPTETTITRKIQTFDDVDFNDFTFNISNTPKAFKIPLKAKKFVYFKIRLENNSATKTFVVLNMTFRAEYGSNIK